MSVGEDRLRLGEERKNIFLNFLNLVPKEDIAVAFARSVTEVEREIAFVAKKIREYRHARCLRPVALGELRQLIAEWERSGKKGPRPMAPRVTDPRNGVLPPIPCETETDILVNRGPLRESLECIGPQTLSSELLIPTLTTQKVENLQHIKEAARAVRGTVREQA